MSFREKALDNPINWSFRIGRVFAIDIRVHILFVLGAFALVAMDLPAPDAAYQPPLGRILVHALGTYAILFAIVLLHEFGHCYGARRTGGDADQILLWPLGGLAYVNPPHNPTAHMITTLAGPAVNVIICAATSITLVAWMGSLGAVPWNPLHPTSPVGAGLDPTASQKWVMVVFGISYVLLIINLFPIFPFDGGRVLQAWLWPKRGYRASMELATGTGMVGAIVIGVIGLLAGEWLLMMIAVFGYLTCYQNRRQVREQGQLETGFGNDYGDSYALGDGDEPQRQPGYFKRRRQRKAAKRAQQERDAAKKREHLLEEALRQVSVSGIESLSARQRRLLEEETHRRRSVDAESNQAPPST